MGAMIPTMITGIRLSNSLPSAKKLVHELYFSCTNLSQNLIKKPFTVLPDML